MSGRYEHQMHINKVIASGLDEYPDILEEYFRKSSGHQASYKQTLINNAKRFIDYLKSTGKEVNGTDYLSDITADDIINYLELIKVHKLKNGKTKILSDSTMLTNWNLLNNFFEFLIKQKYIKENPMDGTKEFFPRYKIKKQVVYMTVDEVKTVRLNIAKHSDNPKRDMCIFMLGCRTGLRQSAIREIDINDIDFHEMIIHVVEKGNVYRDIFIDPDTVELIKDYMKVRGNADTDALFLRTTEKRRITAWDMKRILEKCTIDLTKRITPHKMRATCATNLYLQTGDIYQVADKLGHANIENTRRYTNGASKGRESAKIMGNLY